MSESTARPNLACGCPRWLHDNDLRSVLACHAEQEKIRRLMRGTR